MLALKSTLLLVLTGMLLLTFKKASASLRHWLISLTIIGLLAIPPGIYFFPVLEVKMPVSGFFPTRASAIPFTAEDGFGNSVIVESEPLATGHFEENTSRKKPALPPAGFTFFLSGIDWQKAICCVWLLGSVFFLLRLVLGIFSLSQMTKKSVPFQRTDISIHSPRALVLSSQAIQSPLTWGFVNPVILLPEAAGSWSKTTLETVILHEMAHIHRGDFWVHVLSTVSASFYWWHPLVWWIKKRQLLEREKACDEFVLIAGLPKEDYAGQLVTVARHLSTPKRNSIALPMAKLSHLKQRVLAILKFRKERFRFGKGRRFQWVALYLAALTLLVTFTPVRPAVLMEKINLKQHLVHPPVVEKVDTAMAQVSGGQVRKRVADFTLERRAYPETITPIPSLPLRTSPIPILGRKKLDTVKKGLEAWSSIDARHSVFESIQQLKEQRLIPIQTVQPRLFGENYVLEKDDSLELASFGLREVPLAKVRSVLPVSGGMGQKVGRTKPTKTMTGGNGLMEGQKFGSVISKIPAGSVLRDFNFHLRRNDFQQLTFHLSLYSINAHNITHAVTSQPIRLNVTNPRGWVSVDLEGQQILVEGKVLAILELVRLEGNQGEGYLFFSQGRGPYAPFYRQSDKVRSFWEEKLAFYFTVIR